MKIGANDLDKLIEAINGSTRSFGREEILSTNEELINQDKKFAQTVELLDQKFDELIQQEKDAVKNGAPQEVINALHEQQKNMKDLQAAQQKQRQNNTTEEAERIQRNKAINNLSGYTGYSLFTKGESLSVMGKAISKLGKGFGGIGKMVSKVGGGLSKFAGIIGVAINVISAFTNAIGATLSFMAEQKEYETKIQGVRNEEKINLLQSRGQIAQAQLSKDIAIQQSQQNNAISLATEGNAITTNAEATAHQIATQSLFDIKGGAFAAAEAAIKTSTDIYKFKQHEKYGAEMVASQQRVAESNYQMSKTQAELSANTAMVNADTQEASLTLQKGQAKVNAVMGVVSSATLGISDQLGQTITGGIQATQTANLNAKNQEQQFAAQYGQTLGNLDAQLKNSAAQANEQFAQATINMQKTMSDQAAEAAHQIKMAYLKMTQTVFDAFQKAEQSTYEMGRGMGISAENMTKYSQSLAHTQTIVGQWGKTSEDVGKLQMSFQETTGRNRNLSTDDFNKSFAFGKLVGDDIVTQLDSGIEIFNMGIADANDGFHEMYKQVSRMGLNGKKAMRDLINGLKSAQKYNFKDGVKGVQDMVKWAQNVRFNMGSLDGMIDKVQTGGLEGLIKQSAELQVLGGNFAMNADPFAMGWESYMDPEGSAKRMNRMFAGLGYMKEDGSVGFGIYAQRVMRSAAESMGIDYKDAIAQATQHYKIGKIQNLLDTSQNFDEEQQAMIANKAEYKEGQWRVNIGKDEQGNDIFKNVSEITTQDVAEMGNDHSDETVEVAVGKLLSTQERMEGAQNTIKARLMEEEWTTLRDTANKLISSVQEDFINNYSTYHTELKGGLKAVETAQGSFLTQFKKSIGDKDSVYNTVVPAIKKGIDDLNTNVSGIASGVGGYVSAASSAIVAAIEGKELEENLDNIAVSELRAHMKDKEWLKQSRTKDTDAFKIMNTLYTNFNKYYDELNKEERALLSLWKPIGEHVETDLDVDKARAIAQTGTHFTEEDKIVQGAKYYRELSYFGALPEQHIQTISGNWGTVTTSTGDSRNAKVKFRDGIVYQNGNAIKIDDQDQVLAAKNGGPIDKMLDIVAKPLPYDGFVRETFTNINSGGNGKIEIPPIQININGSIQLNGTGGSIDITQQLSNDPIFIRSISQIISLEVEKKVNGGRVISPLNRNLSWNS